MSASAPLAHSEAERRRTLCVIKLLDEPGTLDEIGIGAYLNVSGASRTTS